MNLKVGDKIRITHVPILENGYIHPDTIKVFKKLIKRNRPVRISRIDEGIPWYDCKFKKKNGTWEHHTLAILQGDNNWIKVKKRDEK